MYKNIVWFFCIFLLVSCWDSVIETKQWKNIEQNIEAESKQKIQKEYDYFSCKEEYQWLLDTYGKDFSGCNFDHTFQTSCKESINDSKVNVVVVMDSSWSMWKIIWHDSMMEILKEELKRYLFGINNDNVQVSLVLYWHKWDGTNIWKSESCSWVEEIYSLWRINSQTLEYTIDNVQPKWWTPIANSFKKVDSILALTSTEDKNIVLLVSDGEETCGWDPVKEAKIIKEKYENTIINVIWFNVNTQVQTQLKNIAENWGWTFNDVYEASDFQEAFWESIGLLEWLECAAWKTSITLKHAWEWIKTYIQCISDLREEQTEILLNASPVCVDDIQEYSETKYDEYEIKFEGILESSEQVLNDFDEHISEMD